MITTVWLLYVQSELEDLSFMYSHPEDYANLKKRVEEVYSEHEDEALEVRAKNNDN